METTLQILQRLFAEQADTAKALTGAYSILLGGTPNQQGYVSLINTAVSTNYGAGPGPVFNQENIFINSFNSLVQGNDAAKSAFLALLGGKTTLSEQVAALYAAFVPAADQTAEGLAFFTRPEGLKFYQDVATERGVAGDTGGAIIALSSLVNILTNSGQGIGAQINAVAQDVIDGSTAIPEISTDFTPLSELTGPSITYSGQFVTKYNIADGTAELASNTYVESTAADPAIVRVKGGADLVITAEVEIRGNDGGVSISGEGSSLTHSGGYFGIGSRPGDAASSFLQIGSGAIVTLNNGADFAARRTFVDNNGFQVGQVGGSTKATVDVTSGGTLNINGFTNFASYFARSGETNDGTETALAIVNITGAGSVLNSSDEFAEFGTTKGGSAEVTVSEGASINFARAANFGNFDRNSDVGGGEGSLTVTGAGSKVVYKQFLTFGDGSGSVGSLKVLEKATAEGFALQIGRNGGTGTGLVDNSSVLLKGNDADTYGIYFDIGRLTSSNGTFTVQNGGSVVLDGEGENSVWLRVGREGTGTLTVTGSGSSVTLQNDAPDKLDKDGFSLAGFVDIGRDTGGDGTLSIMDGGRFTNTADARFEIGRQEGTGVVHVDGTGSSLDAGRFLRLGDGGGTGTLEVTNNGTVKAGKAVSDGTIDILVNLNSEIEMTGSASLTGDLSNEGTVKFDLASGQIFVGDFTQSNGGKLELASVSMASSAVNMTGDLKLDGKMIVDLTGATFVAGDQIDLLITNDPTITLEAGFDVDYLGLGADLDAQVAFGNGKAVLTIGTAAQFADDFITAA